MASNVNQIPFRYPGGKFYAIKILTPFWQLPHDEYREPFVGGGTVFFVKDKAAENWLNDVDEELMTTYSVMKSTTRRCELIRRVSVEQANRERWSEIKAYTPNNDLDVAFKYYYLNRTSFSGKLSSAAWGYRPKRSVPPERWSEKLIPCGEKLSKVKLTCGDFEEVILTQAKNKSSKVLMFVDPPYFSPPKNKHYRSGFLHADHIRLANTLKKTKHKFFLTYDDVPEVRELYSWANINDINFIYRVENSAYKGGSRRNGFELVITNYSLKSEKGRS